MTNRPRIKGTAWETACVVTLCESGWPNCERRTCRGVNDCGDVAGLLGVTIECKAEAKYDLPGWLDELDKEMANTGNEVGFVWAKRKGRTSPLAGYVVMRPEVLFRLLKGSGY